jgi:hypothetical protein
MRPTVPQSHAATGQGAAVKKETGWLIERPKSSGPTFWTGSRFSADILEAIRFCRQVDAERTMKHLLHSGVLIATEHEWIPAPKPGTTEYADAAEDRHFAGED